MVNLLNLAYDLEERLSELFCVVLCTEVAHFLTVLWIGFCLTGPISLCVDLFVFVCILCVFLFHTV